MAPPDVQTQMSVAASHSHVQSRSFMRWGITDPSARGMGRGHWKVIVFAWWSEASAVNPGIFMVVIFKSPSNNDDVRYKNSS